MCNNKYHAMHFIALQRSQDQPSTQEFTNYIGQPLCLFIEGLKLQ